MTAKGIEPVPLEIASSILAQPRPRPVNRVLVPVLRGQSVASILSIGDAVARHCPSRGVVLSLVEIPARWSGLVTSAVVRSRELLRWIAASDYELDTVDQERLSVQSRYTSDPAASIREVLLEAQCDVVVAEWPQPSAPRRHRLEAILQSVASNFQLNLVVARPDPAAKAGGIRPKSVLVPLRGGANAWLALTVAVALASHADARLTLLHVYDRSHHPEHRKHEEAAFHELSKAAAPASPRIVELNSRRPAELVLRAGMDYDAVVLGAHANPAHAGVLVGTALSSALDQLSKTVIVARAASGLVDAA